MLWFGVPGSMFDNGVDWALFGKIFPVTSNATLASHSLPDALLRLERFLAAG